MQQFKQFLKSHPRLFDLVLRIVPGRGYTDEIFETFSRKLNGDVRFIQIGAADGLRWDPMRRYIVVDGWKGVLVEPIPSAFSLLKKNYAHHSGLTFVNAAISGRDSGSIQFWTFSDTFLDSLPAEVRLYYLRKSTFEEQMIIIAATMYTDEERAFLKANGYSPPPSIRENVVSIPVECMTVGTLIERYAVERVDFLMIDTEGHEAEIIPAIDFSRVKPRAILYETMNIEREVAERLAAHLVANGYSVRDLETDAFATLRD